MATLVQQSPAAFNAGLCQPDAVRANLAGGSGQKSQFMISVMGYGIQGQGQTAISQETPLRLLMTIKYKGNSMNWGQGLKRVSILLWTCVAIFSIGYVGSAIIEGEKHSVFSYLFLFALAVVAPFFAHKVTFWVARGFTAK